MKLTFHASAPNLRLACPLEECRRQFRQIAHILTVQDVHSEMIDEFFAIYNELIVFFQTEVSDVLLMVSYWHRDMGRMANFSIIQTCKIPTYVVNRHEI